jgi:CBS domain-containing protein
MRARGTDRSLVAAGWSDWSWVEREDLERVVEAGKGATSLADALRPRSVIRVYPDQSLESALWLLGPYPILPVLSRVNPGLLLGTLSLEDVERAYGIGRGRSVQ